MAGKGLTLFLNLTLFNWVISIVLTSLGLKWFTERQLSNGIIIGREWVNNVNSDN